VGWAELCFKENPKLIFDCYSSSIALIAGRPDCHHRHLHPTDSQTEVIARRNASVFDRTGLRFGVRVIERLLLQKPDREPLQNFTQVNYRALKLHGVHWHHLVRAFHVFPRPDYARRTPALIFHSHINTPNINRLFRCVSSVNTYPRTSVTGYSQLPTVFRSA
jgi:hypothetical protein